LPGNRINAPTTAEKGKKKAPKQGGPSKFTRRRAPHYCGGAEPPESWGKNRKKAEEEKMWLQKRDHVS